MYLAGLSFHVWNISDMLIFKTDYWDFALSFFLLIYSLARDIISYQGTAISSFVSGVIDHRSDVLKQDFIRFAATSRWNAVGAGNNERF